MTSNLTILAQEALAERPITKERLLSNVPKSNELYPLIDMFATFLVEADRKNTVLMQNREVGRSVSRKAIRTVLLNYPEYLRGFTDVDDKVCYLGRQVESKGSVAIRLAQKLEDEFFPNKEIDTPVLLTAIRAALIYADVEVNEVIPDIDLLNAFKIYIDAAKTKARTRMPVKAMVDLFPYFNKKIVLKAITDCKSLKIMKDDKSNGPFIYSTICLKTSII